MGARRQFSREFKLEAVRLVKERGVSVPQAARDLNVHQNVLRKWVREAAADPQQAFPGKGAMKPEQAEIERLKKEVAKLKSNRPMRPFLTKKKPAANRRWRAGSVSNSELLWQSCLLEHAVGGVPRQDLVVDRERCSAAWRVPDIVIALAVADKHAASLPQQPDQLRREALAHVVRLPRRVRR